MLIIPILLFFTFRSSTVQTWLAVKATEYLSRELDAKISVGGVNITYGLNIVLEDVEIHDKSEHLLLTTRRMVFDVNRISRSSRFILVNKIIFDQASLNVARYERDDHYNFQFLVDYFSSPQKEEPRATANWDLIVRSFEFVESSLSFSDHNKDRSLYGFDASNFAFRNLNIEVKDIFLEKDTLQATITDFSVDESRGFNLQSVSSEFMISPSAAYLRNFSLTTGSSQIELDLHLAHNDYRLITDIFDEVSLTLDIKPSQIDLYEVGYFFPEIYGIEGNVDLAGQFSGKLNSLRGNNISFRYGNRTEFAGNFNVVGLPDIDETFINLSIDQLVTHKNDLAAFRLPVHLDQEFLNLPTEIETLGLISFNGTITGFPYDFVTNGNFSTALGNFRSNIAIMTSNGLEGLRYNGQLSTRRFQLGKLVNNSDDFGNIAFDARVQGSGTTFEQLDLSLDGEVTSFSYKDYEYQHLDVNGTFKNKRFNGSILLDDPNIFLDFGGMVDFQNELPDLNFTAIIENANLSQLNIYQRDTLYHSLISSRIHVNGRGSALDNIEGEINAYSTKYFEKKNGEEELVNQLATDVIALEARVLENGFKNLRFYSDFLDVQVEGELHYDKVIHSVNRFLYNYIPSRFENEPRSIDNGSFAQVLEFNAHIKNVTEITKIFIPDLSIATHSFFSGNLNTKTNYFTLQGNLEYLGINGVYFNEPEISITSDMAVAEIIARGDKLFLSDSIWMEQFFTSAFVTQDTITLLSQWENQSPKGRNLGSLKAQGTFISPSRTVLQILPSYAYINDSLWTISPNNRIALDSTAINIDNFHLFKNNEYLLVNGTLSDQASDTLDIRLNNFNIESLGFLLGDRKIDFSGIASGELKLSNLRNSPNILTQLLIKDFAFNHDHLGDLSVESNWDTREKAFRIKSEVIYYGNVGYNKPIIASGYFYPERETDNFDLDITIENLKMSVFSRYLDGFASNFRGLASGRLRLDGPTAAPELSGNARLVRTGFRVNYLNTTYSFAHELTVGKDFFRFDNLILNDTLGNSARASGIIRHNNFMNFGVDISLMPERMIVLNTMPHHNDLFYGKGFASGIVRVHGPVEDITIDVSAVANRGTQIFLPMDYRGEIAESSFITFVPPETDPTAPETPLFAEHMGLNLNFDVSVTPEAEIQIIFDSQIGDILRARGFGDIKVEVDNQGAFNMYGDYTIQEGDYLFTLQNLINKRFRMEQGGTIRWSGDPYGADIDIRALYRTRTSLFDIAATQADTSDVYRRRVPVETVLHLTDQLFNPSINFDIQLPGSDEATRDMLERLITTEQEMNRQVFSLLILNRFVPPEEGLNTALSYGMGSTSSELLSNQLSNWLSQISSDFDIGINYRPGDEITSQELEVALSTQLFDDRVIIDGNLGFAEDHPAQTHRTSNIIGDVNVEVKISPEGKFRIKAFNRSNTFDVLNTTAPYTQGVGVFYRREFDSLSDIFRRTRRVIPEVIPDLPEIDEYESIGADN